MTETNETTAATQSEAAGTAPKKRGGGLNAMLIADLKSMAGGMGISGASSMKKAQLVEAIKAAQSGAQSGATTRGKSAATSPATSTPESGAPIDGAADPTPEQPRTRTRNRGGSGDATAKAGAASDEAERTSDADQGRQSREPEEDAADREAERQQGRQDRQQGRQQDRPQGNRQSGQQDKQSGDQDRPDRQDKQSGQQDRQQGSRQSGQQDNKQQDKQQDNKAQDNKAQGNRQGGQQDKQSGQDGGQSDKQQQGGQHDRQQDNQSDNRDDQGTGRNRRRRGRDRTERTDRPERGGRNRNEPDTTILEDDVLVPAAGILDVLDNYAFVRTSGYLPGVDDVYVSLSMVRKFGLRRGDAIVGQVRQPREGERKEKFNPMVRIDAVNGADPESARSRVEFSKLTPLYPTDRLRMETVPGNLIGRVIDIAAPIGKGQRGLIVSPAKAGKTMIMKSIANSITTNNPECHLMVVLVDERPEEVTDFERSVKGEVISSTFDRPAADHTTVAELAIERAKRLVELGHDVVLLLDGITRLGRAYNLSAPASGRILSGGVDSAALYPPKKFFGAARNIEDGGSLTILATALIESGSKMDEVIFEEFKGTGNMELRLRRELADKRIFPAIDAVQSGTRREEMLMSEEELAIVWKLRRVLSGLDSQQALELLLERLKKAQTNIEFLMQVQKTTPTPSATD
ncbi:transcription termination factor Rho [Nocardioides jensenii]|uniref:transcription termination factor Rho n=1 Tax=Nocardioides jensenii TaxID=1843 RepID=UPI00082D6AE5|nr:transcription termination factor Rho [Nocardioides jensenii]